MSDVSNNGQTHWSFLHTGTACHHTCALEEVRRYADEKVFADGCQCESCKKRKAEVARLEQVILDLSAEYRRIKAKREEP